MDDPEQRRSVETRVTVEASLEEVWRALTTRQGLQQWFARHAQDVIAGGRFVVAWGEGATIDARVDVFEPHAHLRWVDERRDASGRAIPLVTDILLERDGAQTRLRIVTSGFGSDDSWDDEFDGVVKGWHVFAVNLRHYLAHHLGALADPFGVAAVVPMTRWDAWRALLGPTGLGASAIQGRGPASLAPPAAPDAPWDAVVDIWRPPAVFGVVLPAWNRALLRFELVGLNAPPVACDTAVLAWRLSADRDRALKQAVSQAVATALGVPPCGPL